MLQLVDKAAGASIIATTNMMMTARGPMFLSDTAINIDPSADDLAKNYDRKTARMFGVDPVIAMVSFSNFGSSTDSKASKVRGSGVFA
jgi:malate dehydrogenase (oxaloacetate-decarboxylating)(NADP+)